MRKPSLIFPRYCRQERAELPVCLESNLTHVVRLRSSSQSSAQLLAIPLPRSPSDEPHDRGACCFRPQASIW